MDSTKGQHWRADLRSYLGEHIDEPLSVGDLFKRFGASIPLHTATRFWVAKTGREIGDTTHDHLRRTVFAAELSRLPISYDANNGLAMTTMITPKLRPCAKCGAPFFGLRDKLTCSQSCALNFGRDRPRQAYTIRKLVRIEQLTIEGRYREPDANVTAAIADSVKRIGLQTPISVYDCDEGLFLVAGRHRVEAFKTLGRDEIDALVFTDKREAELWGVAENLHRAELTALERADAFDAWRRLTGKKVSQVGTLSKGRVGIREAARAAGISKSDAHRLSKIASLSDAAKQAARDAGHDNNQSVLERAAAHDDPKDQIAALKRVRATKRHIDARQAFCAWLKTLDDDALESLTQIDLAALVEEWISGKTSSGHDQIRTET